MKTVDLFSGCGGLSLGFQNAEFEIVAAFDFWDVALDIYRRNFSHPAFRLDLSQTREAIEAIREFSPDVVIGSPPCQDFSQAGKRIESSRAGLTESFAEIVRAIRPRYFVMENVARAARSVAFSRAESIFRSAGYGLTAIVLDASRCGVPQKRKRFFCVGGLSEQDDFLKESLLKKLSDRETTLRDYFGDSLDVEFYYRHPRNYNRRAIFSIDEPSPTIRGVNRPIPKGYESRPNDAAPLTNAVRVLTTAERARIQTFPADFRWIGSKTNVEQAIGNAVPVELARFVAVALKKRLSERTESS